MQLETSNNIYGPTVNPRNRTLTAGGSTGGEGALMGMKGSPLGIGGDIGGSIRVPAALNGVYGFYPSIGRLSGEGALVPSPGCDSIPGTLGPFTRSVRDIELFCNAYSQTEPWMKDISLIPGDILGSGLGRPLRPGKPLRVGVIVDDGVVSPFPPVRHVVTKIRDILEKDPRIEVVKFHPLDHAGGWRIIAANYFEDGGADIRKLCKDGGESLLPLTDWILKECETSAKMVSATMQGRKTARDQFRQKYNAHWNDAGVDVVLAPVTPSTAPPLGAAPYWGYTAIWNLLQYPAIVFPASKFMHGWNQLNLSDEDYHPKNEKERKMFEDYSPAVSQGLPVGLQVVAKKMHEATLLQATYVIEEVLHDATQLNSHI
ncbi:unnamed protein product [Penicillium salamii]|nr:unnamed protein product [Penicillium salamii]